jgi:mono/diheme cytochrome c family protein
VSGTRSGPLAVVVTITEVVALLAAVAFVVLLFANEPADTQQAVLDDPTAATGPDGGPAAVDGAVVFAGACASCHGAEGEGGIGPTLADGAVVEAFPDVADQIVIVTEGRGGMPDFGDSLSPEEIEAVVLYTREL